MLDIQFEVAGRKLDPCFISDNWTKSVLLRAAREVKKRFADIRIPDRCDPLRILITGDDINHLRYELHGSPEVMDMVKREHGHTRNEILELAATA